MNKYKDCSELILIEELKGMRSFIKIYTNDNIHLRIISLKDDISFKEFKISFPEYNKKDLLYLFDECEKRHLFLKDLEEQGVFEE